jgi:hypothetical protein
MSVGHPVLPRRGGLRVLAADQHLFTGRLEPEEPSRGKAPTHVSDSYSYGRCKWTLPR